MMKTVRLTFYAPLFCLLGMTSLMAADAQSAGQVEADKKALAPILMYVGGWRGVGLPKQGAAFTGWSEETDWQFDLKGGHAALVFSSDKGKFYKSGRIQPGEKAGTYKFMGVTLDGKTEEMTGEIAKKDDGGIEKGNLVFENPSAGDGRPARMVFGIVAKGARMVVDLDKKSAGGHYSTFCEMGYTRKGSGFGQSANSHECIITGGVGKIEVSYKGQTYWVCCGGCKDAFNENPEKEIAAYKKRKEEEKMKDAK